MTLLQYIGFGIGGIIFALIVGGIVAWIVHMVQIKKIKKRSKHAVIQPEFIEMKNNIDKQLKAREVENEKIKKDQREIDRGEDGSEGSGYDSDVGERDTDISTEGDVEGYSDISREQTEGTSKHKRNSKQDWEDFG